MYSDKIEALINAALADGELTEKEKQILFRKAEAEGIDLDEFEMVLDARLFEVNKAQQKEAQAAQQAAPKSNKFGDIRKCPACGAIVATGSAVCVECGYAFNEDAGTTAMDKLYDRLQAIEDKYQNKSAAESIVSMFTQGNDLYNKPKEKLNAVMTFNVPNTRAELLGLLSSLQPIANPDGPKAGYKMSGEDLSLGYWLLFVNCINKAKMSFANDKTFEPYYNYYEENRPDKKKSGGFFSMFKK
jgi:hypothetical protein